MKVVKRTAAKQMNKNPKISVRNVTHAVSFVSLFILANALAMTARATVLTYTNSVAGSWAAATDWSPNSNWSTGTWKTNVVNTGLRLNFGNSSAFTANAVYTAAEGNTTIDVSSGAETRALVIGNGSGVNANLTISGGTLVAVQNAANTPVLVGTPGQAGAMNANLTLCGGNLMITNGASASGLTVLFRGGGTAKSTVTVTNGSVLAVDQINIGDPTQQDNQWVLGASGTINLGGSGSTGTIQLRSLSNGKPAFVKATNNFDGGILKISGAEQSGLPLLGTNLVNNILAGGLIVNCQTNNARILSPLINNTGGADGGLTKQGNGTLSLFQSCTYNGNTTVSAGTLALGSSITLASGFVTVASGAALAINVSNTPISLSSVSFTNAYLNFNYGAFAGNTNAVANVTNLILNGTVTVNVSGTAFPVTNLTLLTYNGKSGTGAFALGTLPSGAAATLADTGSALILNVTTASIQSLTWTDASGDNTWQVNGQADWNPPGSTYLEYPSGSGDVVTFDDTYNGGTVLISGMVSPATINVNDTVSFYAFGGSGTISGATGVTKSGTSTLDILTSNSFMGVVTVSAGTLFVDNANALGSTNGGTVVSGGGTLELGLSGGLTVAGETVTISGAGVGGASGALRGTGTSPNIWAGPVVVGAQSARIGTEINGNLTVSGTITDNGANYELFIRPAASGTVTISGANSTYGSTRFFGDSTGTGTLKIGANNALVTNLFTMGPGYFDLNGFNQTVGGISDLSGSGIIYNNGGSPVTLTINNAATNSTASAIQDGASQMSLIKLGVGRQNLNAASSYTGATLVNRGELDVVLPMSSSALTLADSTAMGITVSNSSWSPFTINVTNSALTFNYGAQTGIPAAALSATTLNVSGSNVINISATSLPTGTIPLIAYSSKVGTGGFYLGALPTNVQATIADTGSAIVLNVTFAPMSLTWWGGVTGTWNTNNTLDWNSGGSAYHDSNASEVDSVFFDDTASTFSVSVTSDVHPYSITVNNAINSYTIGGTAEIGGTNGITKNGTNVLNLTSPNNYTGGTTINAGTVSFANGALSSTGDITLLGSSSSVLQWAPGNNEDISSRLKIGGNNSAASTTAFATLDVATNDVTFDSGVNQSNLGGVISNVVAKVGSGKLTLAGGTTSFGSVVRINQGTLEVTSGATLNVNGAVAQANAALVADNSTILVTGGTVNIADRLSLATFGYSTSVVTVVSGSLTSDSGSTQSDRGIRLAGGSATPTSTNMATVNLNGGSLIVSRLFAGSGSNNISIVNFNGGLLQPSDNPIGGTFLTGLTHAYVNSGGAIINTGTNSLTIGQSLENDGVAATDGGLVKLGSGRLILGGTNSYTGSTVVSNGTLWVSGLIGTNLVSVLSGATLGSTGVIGGPVTVQVGGKLMPGTGVATNEFRTVNSSLNLAGTTVLQIGKSGAAPISDQVVGVTDVTYGGTLIVTNADNSSLAGGDVFTLFVASGSKSGNFTSVQVVPTSLGLTATFSPATGQLTLANSAPPVLIYSNTGSALQFSWTGGGKLQVQTNGINSGLGTNWVDYPGGSSSPVNVPVDRTQGSVFFRVAQ
jgi:fibronectin-binding autotransporter adhesin